MPKIIPWNEVREAYVKRPDKPTLNKLATEYNIHWTTIAKRSGAEGWKKQREEYHEAVGRLANHGPTTGAEGGQGLPAQRPEDRAYDAKQSLTTIDRIIGLLAVKLEPAKEVRNKDGEVVDFEFKITPFSNVIGVARLLTEMITLRMKLEPTPNVPGLPTGPDGKPPKLEYLIERVKVWSGRICDDDGLAKAGARLMSQMEKGHDIIEAEVISKTDMETSETSHQPDQSQEQQDPQDPPDLPDPQAQSPKDDVGQESTVHDILSAL